MSGKLHFQDRCAFNLAECLGQVELDNLSAVSTGGDSSIGHSTQKIGVDTKSLLDQSSRVSASGLIRKPSIRQHKGKEPNKTANRLRSSFLSRVTDKVNFVTDGNTCRHQRQAAGQDILSDLPQSWQLAILGLGNFIFPTQYLRSKSKYRKSARQIFYFGFPVPKLYFFYL